MQWRSSLADGLNSTCEDRGFDPVLILCIGKIILFKSRIQKSGT